jgi:hypothetical protein
MPTVELATRRSGFRFRACQTCGGDAYLDLTDAPEWRCLQCARPVPNPAAGRPVTVTGALRAAMVTGEPATAGRGPWAQNEDRTTPVT